MIRIKQGTFKVGVILFLLALGQHYALEMHNAYAQPASFSPLVKKQRSKVVHIGIREKKDVRTEGHGLFPYWRPEPRQGMGSGVIISSDGLILTNHHVVSNTEFIEVVLENGRKYEAEIIGSDQQTDLALIKIDAKKLSVVEFGNSDKVEVGDWVVAIGNPWGLSFTVTAGIISAKGRNIFESENLAFGEFIQTDAAINPGNSGGPLFNLKGKVIGVNTAISNKGYGIGFAVPSNLVVEVIRHLKEYGRVIHGWLGVVIATITPERIRTLKLPRNTSGILIEEVLAFAPADKAGIKTGDVLTKFGKEKLSKVTQLQKLVTFSKPGSKIPVMALRRKNKNSPWKSLRFSVGITSPPEQYTEKDPLSLRKMGLSVISPSPVERNKLGLDQEQGVVVKEVTPRGLAEQTGLRKGDVILEVNSEKVATQSDLVKIFNKAGNVPIPILVKRKKKILYLVITPKP